MSNSILSIESDNVPKIIQREKKCVDAMILIYCKVHHGHNDLVCSKCFEFGVYAKSRVENCQYKEKKPACGHCGLTCFNSQWKTVAEVIFSYSGPRMLFEHPILALYHLLDGFRNAKQLKNLD